MLMSTLGKKTKGVWLCCSYCNKPIWITNSRIRHKNNRNNRFYCNIKCKGGYLANEYLRDGAPNWKGGRVFYKGRPAIYIPEHPRANKEGYVYEHIITAEKALGRHLKFIRHAHPDNEVVHHIDENKANNKNSNLLICSSAYHKRLHLKIRRINGERFCKRRMPCLSR